MGKLKNDWPAIKSEFVEGSKDSEGHRIFLSGPDIATKYRMHYGTLRNRIARDKWLQERDLYITKVEKARQEKKVDVLAGKSAEFDSKCLKVAEAGISHIASHMQKVGKDKKLIPLSLTEANQLSQALKNFQQIGRLALGDSTEKVDGPRTQINNLVAVDMSGLAEEDISKLVGLGFKLKSLIGSGDDT